MTFIGTLNFVASQDLGDLGSEASRANEFVWHWYYAAPTMVPWLILALALMLPRVNRHGKAWQVLIPVAAIYGLWRLLLWALENNLPSASAQQFEMLIVSLCVASAVMWLFAHTRPGQKGIVRFFRGIGILAMVSCVNVWCLQGTMEGQTIMFLILFSMLWLAFALSMVWARRLSKKTYRPVAFTLCLLPCTVVLSIASVFIAYAFMFAIMNSTSMGMMQLLLISLFGGSVFGVMLYLINLPFLILGALCPFYRERFQTYMNLKPKIDIQGPDIE